MKQEIWIARDKWGGVYLYDGKPVRNEKTLFFEQGEGNRIIGSFYAPFDASDITWENSPQRFFSLGCIENLTISNRKFTAQYILKEIQHTLWRSKKKSRCEDITPLLSWCMCLFVWNISFNFKTNRASKARARKYLLDQFNKWWNLL